MITPKEERRIRQKLLPVLRTDPRIVFVQYNDDLDTPITNRILAAYWFVARVWMFVISNLVALLTTFNTSDCIAWGQAPIVSVSMADPADRHLDLIKTTARIAGGGWKVFPVNQSQGEYASTFSVALLPQSPRSGKPIPDGESPLVSGLLSGVLTGQPEGGA